MPAVFRISNPILNVGLKFGIYGGVLSFFAFLFFYFIDERPIPSSKFIDVVIIWLFSFFAMQEFKKFKNNNLLSYSQGVSVGIISFLTTSVVSSLLFFVFLQWIDPGLFTDYLQDQESLLLENKERFMEDLSETEFRDKLSSIREGSAQSFIAGDFMLKGLVGLFGAILFAALLRRSPQTQDKRSNNPP